MVPSMQIMSGASLPMAAKAALRPDQMRARCFSSVASHRLAAALAATWSVDPRHGIGDIGLHAVGVDDQDGLGAGGIAGRVVGFDRFGGAPVHELHRGRHNAVGDDGGDAGARIGHGVEAGQQGAGHRRLAQDLHRHFHHHAQQAFRAGDQAQQIKPALRAGTCRPG